MNIIILFKSFFIKNDYFILLINNNMEYENNIDCQDWTEVKIGGGRISNDKNKKNVVTQNKPKTQNQPGTKTFHKLDSEDIYVAPKIDKNVSLDIQTKRNLCSLTQKELATQLNLPVNIINEIESGKSSQNKGLINRINRFLDNKIKKK